MILYDYQQDMKERITRSFMSARSVMAQMPTGTGKTVVLATVVREFLCDKKNARVWIVAHRRELVEQIEATLDRMMGLATNDHEAKEQRNRIRVTSIQWLTKHRDNTDGGEPSLVVIDEAHHALARTYKILWERYPEAKFLGLTATPCRLNGKGFTDLFDTLVCSRSVPEFISMGRLALFDYVSVKESSEDALMMASLTKRGADGDFQVREMSRILNNRPTIERLYESVTRYANRKKGIVYAINIEHARNIAAYYSEKGMKAVAIDSRTPRKARASMISDFKRGIIDALVNVDIFSEGFDCPDVEFIQLARPTLSLAKYLQMVGRGLRISEGKSCCVMIDNVGLYRMFGLPTAPWNWQAMFEGKFFHKNSDTPSAFNMVVEKRMTESFAENVSTGLSMGVVMTHDCLERHLREEERDRKAEEEAKRYSVFMGDGLLCGVKAGEEVVIPAAYMSIELEKSGYAICNQQDGRQKIVRLRDRHVFLPDIAYGAARIYDNHIANVCLEYPENRMYIDLISERVYEYDIWEPRTLFVKKIGTTSLLKFNREYFTRTRKTYQTLFPINEEDVRWHGYYYTIDDPGANNAMPVCVLEHDDTQYYWLVANCDDGSIYVMDDSEHYYHVGKDGEKEERPKEEVIKQMERGNVVKATLKNAKRNVEPVRVGSKWGLKVDGKLIVPPLYKKVMPPEHGYCLVESHPYQWGILSLTGKLLVDTKYTHIQIHDDSTAELTRISGKVTTVNLTDLQRGVNNR